MPELMDVARGVLIRAAQTRGTLTYSELADQINDQCPELTPPLRPNDPRLMSLLEAISAAELARKRPLLAALVVRAGTIGPSVGFFNMAGRLGVDPPRSVVGRAEFWLAAVHEVFGLHAGR